MSSASSSPPVLFQVTDLTVAPAGVPLLRSVRFELQPKEWVALVGRSGTGKTSLLRALASLDAAAPGRLRLSGRTPDEWGYPQWRVRVGYVPQRPVMFQGSVAENLARPRAYRAVQRAAQTEVGSELLARVGLGTLDLQQDARELSEGEAQRVALVRSLLLRPDVLLLDEPTSALDPATREGVEDVVRQAVEGGAAALWVTHQPDQAARLSSQVVDIRTWSPA